MKIRVSYRELRSENFNNRSAQAEVEIEVGDRHVDEAFAVAWATVKDQVRKELDGSPSERLRSLEQTDDIPF